MAEEQKSAPESRRGHDRKTILKGAKVVFNDGKGVLVCRVRDMSPGGARLEFAPYTKLPEKFVLYAGSNAPRRCELRWFKSNIAGVKFVDAE
ncbi:MAG TPA: PilZ domain-containing protein [Dongiaceae bacterium]|nr:PilZ domain-containing protein [Dongiaceae bacterium]